MNDILSPAADDSPALKTPRKRAVKKTAASASAPEIAPPPPPAAKTPAKKAAVKKKAASAVTPPSVELPVVAVTPAPPAKKAAAKKAARKTSSAASAESSQTLLPLAEPAPAPEKPPVAAAAAPAVAAPKKKTARKTARAAAEPEPAPAPEPVAPPRAEEAPQVREAPARTAAPSFEGETAPRPPEAGEAPAPRRPFRGQPLENRGQNRHPLLREHTPQPPAGEDTQAQGEGCAPPAADQDGAPPRHGPRQEGRPQHRSHDGPPPRHDGDRDNQVVIGPDGQPRRLNKWERWKQRKEKFKLLKQQRYLERHAGGPPRQGGEGGAPPEGPVRHERDRDRDRGQGHGHPHGPRQDGPRQEHPPRPEPQLGPPEPVEGLLEFSGKGIAFLRPADRGYAASPADTFVSPDLIRQYGLREGVMVEGVKRRGGRGPQLVEIKSVNGMDPNAFRTLPLFEELTAINPNKRYVLETQPNVFTTRLIDFIAPVGRGQRGLIVAPPRAGKTTVLQNIAEAVLTNYESVKVIVLLVDERPEEVTELARALPGAEIMASSNDQDPRNHIRMAQLAVERAKRIVETGGHVFMLLDSITRLARAFNNAMRGGGGKAMSGGIDSRALELPRKLFAAARNTREAGSLTIMATALVETNNKGDDLIFQEFKGTGNMELVLDRKIAQQYVYPAVDIFKSGTRREELLLPPHQLEKVHLIRRGLAGHRPVEAMERLLHFMKRFPGNAQMLVEIKSRE